MTDPEPLPQSDLIVSHGCGAQKAREMGRTFTEADKAAAGFIAKDQRATREQHKALVVKGSRGGQSKAKQRRKPVTEVPRPPVNRKGGMGVHTAATAPEVPVTPRKRKRAELGGPKKHLTHGASYVKGFSGWGKEPDVATAEPKRVRELPPFNSPINTATMRIVETSVIRGSSLDEAAALQGFTARGLRKAKKREERTGVVTPQKPARKSNRAFPLGTKLRADARHYLNVVNPQQSLREAGQKLGASASTLSREFCTGDAEQNRRSTRGRRSAEAGELPLVRKKRQKIMSEANMPRIYDMALSWTAGVAGIPVHCRSWTDESKLKWGDGQHGDTGRAEAGTQLNLSEPYRWKNATILLAAGCRDASDHSSWDILKAHIQPKPMKGDDFARFVLENTPNQGFNNLGGPPLPNTLSSAQILTCEYDMAGRAGRAIDPKKGHFHPSIKPGLLRKGVRGLYGHPKFGMSDPIELLNNLVQVRAAKYPTALRDDEGRPLTGPQTYEMAVAALDWAIGKLREEGKIKRVMEHAVKVRARGQYMESLLGGMTFAAEVRRKRAATPRGTQYTILYRGKEVVCRNLDFKWGGTVTEEEKKQAYGARCAWLPAKPDGWVAKAGASKRSSGRPKKRSAASRRCPPARMAARVRPSRCRRAGTAASSNNSAESDWQPGGGVEPSTLTVADNLEIYTEVQEEGKGEYFMWMAAAISDTRQAGKWSEFHLEYDDGEKVWTRLKKQHFNKGSTKGPGWRLDIDFYAKDKDGSVTCLADGKREGAQQKLKKGKKEAKLKPGQKQQDPSHSSASDSDNVSSDGEPKLSSTDEDDEDSDSGRPNPDVLGLDDDGRAALRLDRDGDTDSDNEDEECDGGSRGVQPTLPPVRERESDLRGVCAVLAAAASDMVPLMPSRKASKRGEMVRLPRSVKYSADDDGTRSAVQVANDQKIWFRSVGRDECTEHSSAQCSKRGCGGCPFKSFESSTDQWMEVTEFLCAFSASTGRPAHVIVNKGAAAPRVFSMIPGANEQLDRTLSDANPDPSTELVIVWNGSNHFNGLAPPGWVKPKGEGGLGVGRVGKGMASWLRRRNCALWHSTPKGFCGYESAAMSLRFLGSFGESSQ